jgi:hypothetical protein
MTGKLLGPGAGRLRRGVRQEKVSLTGVIGEEKHGYYSAIKKGIG